MYAVVASANIIIGLDAANLEGDADEINQMIGQAYAIRALAHFDLLKLFGEQHAGGTLGVPYITEYKGENLTPSRNSVAEVRAAIEADIATALSLMKAGGNDGSKQLLTTYGVQALKSRVGTYFGDWAAVKTASETIINSGEYQILEAADYIGSWQVDAAANSILSWLSAPQTTKISTVSSKYTEELLTEILKYLMIC